MPSAVNFSNLVLRCPGNPAAPDATREKPTRRRSERSGRGLLMPCCAGQALNLRLSASQTPKFEKSQRAAVSAGEFKPMALPVCHVCLLKIPDAIVWSGHALYGTMDHVVPLGLGGPNRRSNKLPAHRICNQRKACRAIVPARERLELIEVVAEWLLKYDETAVLARSKHLKSARRVIQQIMESEEMLAKENQARIWIGNRADFAAGDLRSTDRKDNQTGRDDEAGGIWMGDGLCG